MTLDGVVARVDVDETDEAADEQAAADEEDRGECDLDDYEDAAQAVALQEAEPAHALNARVTQRRHDVDARSLQGRREPEEKSGRERQQRREQQHAPVDGDLVHPWNVARADRGQGPLQHEGEADAQDAAADGEQHALRQELPGKTPRPRAERGADGELALTPGAARQEKVGDVGSGDEQDEPDRRRQHEERRPHAGDHFRLQRDETHEGGRERRGRIGAGGRRRLVAPGRRRTFRFCLRHRHTVFQPADGAEHHHEHLARLLRRNVDRHRRPEHALVIGKVEGRGQDADDGELAVVERDGLADDVGAAPELARPQLLADDGDLIVARPVFVGSEEPSLGGRRAKHREHRRRDRRAAKADRLAEAGQRVRTRLIGGQAVERARALPPVLERAVGDDGAAAEATGAAAAAAPAHQPSLFGHADQPVRPRVGKRPQEDGIDHAEDGGVGAYAEGERRDRHRREPGIPREHAQALPDVLPESLHRPLLCESGYRTSGRGSELSAGRPEMLSVC